MAYYILTSLPVAQRWLGRTASSVLASLFGSEVEIQSIDISMPWRPVLDGVTLYDQRGDTLLAASRMAARINLWQALNEQYRLSHVQLYRPDIRLVQDTAGVLNCQHIIDAFSSETSGGDGTDLQIVSVLLRRGRLSYLAESKDSVMPESILLENLSLTVYGLSLEKKVLKAHLHDLHVNTPFAEIEDMKGSVRMGPDGMVLSGVSLELPYSRLSVGEMRSDTDFASWTLQNGFAALDVRDLPSRITLSNVLAEVVDRMGVIELGFAANGTNETAVITELTALSDNVDLDLQANVRFSPLMINVENLDMEVQDELLSNNPLQLNLTGLYDNGNADAKVQIESDVLVANCEGQLRNNDQWQVTLHIDDSKPMHALSLIPSLQSVTQMFGDSVRISADVTADGSMRSAAWNVKGDVACQSTPLSTAVKGEARHSIVAGTSIHADVDVQQVCPAKFGATGDLANKTYAVGIQSELSWPAHAAITDACGRVMLENLRVLDDTLAPSPLLHNLLVDVVPAADEGQRRVSVLSDCLNAYALVSGEVGPAMNVAMTAHVNDARLINYLADMDLEVYDPVRITLFNDTTTRVVAQVDSIRYDNEILTGVNARATYSKQAGSSATMSLCRHMKNSLANINVDASMVKNKVGGLLTWYVSDLYGVDDPDNHGMLQASAVMNDTTHISIERSVVMLNGTEWNVHPSLINAMPDGALQIDSFAIEAGERHLLLQGRMSKDNRDTLRAELRDVNLGYIFDLIKFDDVAFDGDATGTLLATGLTSSPKAGGRLHVRDFSFNNAILGNLDLLASWDTGEKQLNLDGHIVGDGVPSLTTLGVQVPADTRIVGRVNPGKNNPRSGLDLKVYANGFNLGFLREYTDDIFEDLNGSVSGYVHIYGPFNAIDLNGDLRIDHCTARVPSLNVCYQLGGDSARVRPGRFIFDGVRVSDMQATVDKRGTAEFPGSHTAVVQGGLTHRHFKGMAYDFTAQANNLLGYDEREFGDQSFYGTAYITGDVRLEGGAGRLNVDVSGKAEAGSLLVYNSTLPDALTHSDFITYIEPRRDGGDVGIDTSSSTSTGLSSAIYKIPSQTTDMRLNFNVEVTPESSLKVLMDTRTGDYIELFGNAPIRASYYNKGSFRMYGTYTVQRGRYHMTLQDFIRKDFTFSDGGTITFSGAPMQAALNLQAIYTVPGVSLNDLAASNTFSSQRMRVNCLMNLTGQVSSPQVTFDFELPQASQDEQAMVRSLVSTEEERNLQAIYLLGLGTFYAQDNANSETRSNMAINSFLSSTLSSQINSILGDAIGNSNWSFGTNISTGQMGWSEVQAEGSLSGRLFNDRLLVNGTFGYRDGATTNQTGFVGDFDVQWLLTPRGTVSLKAYSQTTDRYFTKTALTTQGVGLLLKKDFNTLRELFKGRKKQR